MKNLLYILLIILLHGATNDAKACLPFGIHFTTQESIDNFKKDYPGCTKIEGGVSIMGLGSNIKNLRGLSQVTFIGGKLEISHTSLSNLSGLENITEIKGSVNFHSNSKLSNISALKNLTSIQGPLVLGKNNNVSSLFGLKRKASLNKQNGKVANIGKQKLVKKIEEPVKTGESNPNDIVNIKEENTESGNENSNSGKWVLYNTKSYSGCPDYVGFCREVLDCSGSPGNYSVEVSSCGNIPGETGKGTYTIPPPNLIPDEILNFTTTASGPERTLTTIGISFYDNRYKISLDDGGNNVGDLCRWNKTIVRCNPSSSPAQEEFKIPENNVGQSAALIIEGWGSLGNPYTSRTDYFFYKWEK